MTTTATNSSKPRKKRGGGRGSIMGFARSIVHHITGKRIYPKTAKAFPLFARRKKAPPEQPTAPPPPDQVPDISPAVTAAEEPQLLLPFPDNEMPKKAARRRRSPLTPRR